MPRRPRRPVAERPAAATVPRRGRADAGRGVEPLRGVGFPLPRADRARRRRACRREAARSAPTTTPSGPARPRPARPRAVVVDGPLRRPSSGRWPTPRSRGLDRLGPATSTDRRRDLRRQPPQPPRHRRCCCRPSPSRGATSSFVAAAADYFFDNRVAGGARRRWPSTPSRSSAPRSTGRSRPTSAAELHRRRLEPGDLPRGRPLAPTAGASRSGAAPPTSPIRCGVPVVPVHIEGTGRILPKGAKRPKPRPHRRHVRRARCGRPRARTHAASPPASSGRSRRWPTRPPPTGGRPGSAPTPARPRRSAARRPVPGAAPGRSASATRTSATAGRVPPRSGPDPVRAPA